MKIIVTLYDLQHIPLTSLDAAVGVHPVVDQQHQTTERRGVQGQGRLQPPQFGSTAAVVPVFAEVQHVRPDQPQVVHCLQLCSCLKRLHITHLLLHKCNFISSLNYVWLEAESLGLDVSHPGGWWSSPPAETAPQTSSTQNLPPLTFGSAAS